MAHARIHPVTSTPPDALVIEEFRNFPSTVVSDQLERFGLLSGLRMLTGESLGIMAGPALTVLTLPGDNLGVYKAIEMAQPGDVLVVNGGAVTDRALMGEIVYHHAVSRGIAGIVIDGSVRDSAEIGRGTVPVFVRGVSHLGPFKNGPAELRGAIAVGGTVVRQGDVVVGDADGVVVVPFERIPEVVKGARALLEKEEVLIPRAQAGDLDSSWLEDYEFESLEPPVGP